MTTTKQSWFKRSLAVLLAVMMVMSMGVANVFAQAAEISASVAEITETEAKLTITNKGATDAYPVVYYAVLKTGTDVPTAEDLQKSGTQTTDSAFTMGTSNQTTVSLFDLAADTDYTAYAVIYYAKTQSFSDVASVEFTTEGASVADALVVSEITETEAKLTITNTGTTTGAYPVAYYTVLKAGEKTPTAQELKTSGTQTQDGSFTAGSSTETSVTLFDLTAGTDYVAYAVVYYAATQQFGEVVSVAFTTTGTASSTALSVNDIKETEAKLTITNNGATNSYPVAYYTVIEAGAAAPTAQELQSNGIQTTDSNFTTGAAAETSVFLFDLKAGTDYVAYAVIYYAKTQSFSEVLSCSFKTAGDSGSVTPSEEDVMSLTYRNEQGKEIIQNYEDYTKAVEEMNALDASYTDVKLTLLKDISVTVGSGEDWTHIIDINRTCTLDLAGYTYSVRSNSYQVVAVYVYGDLTFTLMDSSSSGTGMIYGVGNSTMPVRIGNSAEGGAYADTEECDVHFIMKSGILKARTLTGQASYALAQPSFAETTIEGGTIYGGISSYGKLTVQDGLIECASPLSVVFVMRGAEFIMTGGTIRNTDTESASLDDNEGQAVGIICADTEVVISGGVLESVNGPALRLEGHMNGGVNDASETTINGNAKLISQNDAAIRFSFNRASNDTQLENKHVLTIDGNAVLKGASSILDIYKNKTASAYTNKLDIKINGGYFRYSEGLICAPNSSYVTYPDGMVLDVEPVSDGEFAGYYTLAKKDDLKQNIGSIEWGYQYFDDLSSSIESARSLYEAGNDTGTYDSTLWDTFTKAYELALPILENQNANQNEINYFAEQLSSAQFEMVDNAQNGMDVSDLADGTYSVQIEMRMTSETGVSMANGAVNPNATLVMKDGTGKLYVDFQPTLVAGQYGSLMKYWVYEGQTPEEAKTNMNQHSAVADYMTEAIYSTYQNVNMATGEVTSIEGSPSQSPSTDNEIRPARVCITLPYMGSSNDYNKIYSRVSVDMMTMIGVGDQNVILYIKYNTLEAVDVQPTLSVSIDKLSMMVGSEETVTATLKGADGYAVTKWESSDPSVATVENGTIKAVGEGNATITVTATKVGAADLTKTISVTVAPAGSESVKVEKVETSGSTETATLTGNFLTSGSTDGITVNGNTITIDAKADASGITSSKVVIPQETAKALLGKTVVVETNTGSVTLDSALLAQIANVNGSVTLSIAEAAVPDKSLGFFSSAYELSLTNASGDKVEFGEGQAAVTVTSEETVNYAYCIDNGQRTERVATSTSGNSVSFTVSHFSLWALSDREYEVGGSASIGFFLEDGNYYVDIALWKSDSNEASMGNVAFKNNDKALVTVKDGKITRVQIGTNPVDIDPYHSAIIEFELADGTEVSIDAFGELTTLPANKDYTYIKLVSFNLPDSAQPDISDAITYVPVNFYVPDTPMDAAVGETLTARLRFTWSTAEKTDDTSLQVDDTTAAGDSPITGEEIVDVNLVDEATGIKLETNSGILSDKAVLSVEKLTQGADYDIAMKAMNGVDGSWNLYKIVALVDGVETAPLGSVVLYIPCGAEGMTLYRVNADGTKTLVRGEVQDGYYVVRTTSLGLFAMVSEAAGTTGGTQNGNQNSNTNIPQTGDNSNVAVYALLALAAAGMMGVTLVTRKRKAEEK